MLTFQWEPYKSKKVLKEYILISEKSELPNLICLAKLYIVIEGEMNIL